MCGEGTYEKMTRVCDSVKQLSLEDFKKFVDAVSKINNTAANKIREKYFQVTSEPLTHETDTVPVPCSYDDHDQPPVVCSNSNAASSVAPIPTFPHINQRSFIGSHHEESNYPMDTDPRGFALIINNVNFGNTSNDRVGSDEDANRLHNMFKYLGFEVSTERNKTAKEMLQVLKAFAQYRHLHSGSALAVAILTHGHENERLCGVDGQCISRIDIQQIFKIGNCKQMKGKPKLFIIQACRGDSEDILTDSAQQLSHDSPSFYADSNKIGTGAAERDLDRTAETADMCFVYSSSLGYKAYRRQMGSPFIETLTNCIVQRAHNTEFSEIMREVQRRLSNMRLGADESVMTLPDLTTQLLKKLYFNPPLSSRDAANY
ncbi:caspase-14-like isoform X2 [Physella acuta]|uniref:caspase-14-like isoform X2 n=1 Tax=Physella acuta TaxID=109671 RepID=UPI0027DC0353|nr:caspase-14-like isoform X2 [Physella acuta]